MERNEAIKYLDTVVDAIEAINKLDDVEGISIIKKDPNLHIHNGIYTLCNALNIKPNKNYRNDTEYPVEVSFDYRGVHFFEIFKIKENILDIENVELFMKEGEEELAISDDEKEPVGVFKDIKESFDEFDKATGNLHADLGTLGVVE